MRLIDADALDLTPIDITDLPYDVCLMVYLEEDVQEAPTVQAVPIDVLDKIRAEIEEVVNENKVIDSNNSRAQSIGLMWVLQIIDKYKAESEG